MTSFFVEDVRFWLRQQQGWNDLRSAQRNGWIDSFRRWRTWNRILRSPPSPVFHIRGAGRTELHTMCYGSDWVLLVWIIGISVHLYFYMSSNCCVTSISQLDTPRFSSRSTIDSVKFPIAITRWTKIFVFNPFTLLFLVSAFGPSPNCFPNLCVYQSKGSFGHCALMIICPSSDFWIEHFYQVDLLSLFISLYRCSDAVQK